MTKLFLPSKTTMCHLACNEKVDLIPTVEDIAVMDSFVQGMEPLVQINEVMGTQR